MQYTSLHFYMRPHDFILCLYVHEARKITSASQTVQFLLPKYQNQEILGYGDRVFH